MCPRTPGPHGRNIATLAHTQLSYAHASTLSLGGKGGDRISYTSCCRVLVCNCVAIFLPPTDWKPLLLRDCWSFLWDVLRVFCCIVGMALNFTRVTLDEIKLISNLVAQDQSLSDIADLLGRNKGTISRHMKALKRRRGKVSKPKLGRRPALTKQQIDRLELKVRQMTKAADAEYQITTDMIKRAAGLKCCERVVLNALHSRGVYLHPLREKPIRSAEDVRDRKIFAQKYKGKTEAWWARNVHAYLDNKFFPVCPAVVISWFL